ncbi:MAG TPA: AAA family ATPase, partial [Plasticicumulans sp.]|nr:AAA family ATPase [Plasticicumulans sp.]
MTESAAPDTDPRARVDDELDRLLAAGAIGPLDREFARLLQRLVRGQGSRAGLLAAALASRQIGLGHVCLPLTGFEGFRRRLLAEDEQGPAIWAPAAAEWIERLRRWPAVGSPGEFRPLVLDADGRLYLYRYWRYETGLAARLVELAQAPVRVDEPRLRQGLDRLFPQAAADAAGPDLQRLACANAALSRLALICGGPGTGKTTTLAKLLALLLMHDGDSLRIRLAAPTGKAAARMLEALRG